MNIFSEEVTLLRRGNTLEFIGKGETTNVKFQMQMSTTHNSVTSALFSGKYLLWFAKAEKLFPHGKLSFDSQSPLRYEFDIEDEVNIKFFLSPKME